MKWRNIMLLLKSNMDLKYFDMKAWRGRGLLIYQPLSLQYMDVKWHKSRISDN